MKFKLNLINHTDNETRSLIYNTDINSLQYENGDILVYNNNNNNNVINKPIKKITIQLGFSCNMSCSYCLQSKTKKNKFNKEQCNKVVEELLKEDLKNSRVEFWGGEPTLYLKEIFFIVNKLKKIQNNMNYLIITNGLLLNKKLIDILIKNNFFLAISHDAQAQNIRGKDPLISNLKNIEYLFKTYQRNSSFNSVITKDNVNTKNRLKFFSSKLNIKDMYTIQHYGEGPVYNTNVDMLDMKTFSNQLYVDLKYGDGMKYGFYTSTISYFLKSLGKVKINDISTKCGINKSEHYKVISIDGKELSCHNYDFKFDIKTLQDSDKCKKCLVAHLCKSSCPAMDKNSDVFKKNCEVMFVTYYNLLDMSIYLLTNKKFNLLNYDLIE